jgi:hypothetical protein
LASKVDPAKRSSVPGQFIGVRYRGDRVVQGVPVRQEGRRPRLTLPAISQAQGTCRKPERRIGIKAGLNAEFLSMQNGGKMPVRTMLRQPVGRGADNADLRDQADRQLSDQEAMK